MRTKVPDAYLFGAVEDVPYTRALLDVAAVNLHEFVAQLSAKDRATCRAWARKERKARRRPFALVWRQTENAALISTPAGIPHTAVTQDPATLRRLWNKVQSKPAGLVGFRFFKL